MRRNRNRMLTTALLTLTAWMLFIPAANAYIDPGTTTALFQGIVAAIAGAGMFLAIGWQRIVAFFRRGATSTPDATDAPANDTADASATDQ